MNKIIYYIAFAFWYTLSLLPLRVLYVLSDGIYYLLYYCMRYRRAVVRKNLAESFPEKSEAERMEIEHGFYHYFCDYIVETVKMFSMSEDEVRRRMTFGNLDKVRETLATRSVILYMGHYCNWEWVSSFPMHMRDMSDVVCSQIYRKLDNKVFDDLFLYSRGRYGAVSLEMHSALRSLVRMRRSGQKSIVGFISDQGPTWAHVNMWTDFLNHKTAFFTAAENLAKLSDASVYYLDVKRVKRGYYHADFVRITDEPKSYPDNELTVEYGRLLEQTIRLAPQFWLWSHKRWKRTYEQWLERQADKQKDKAVKP